MFDVKNTIDGNYSAGKKRVAAIATTQYVRVQATGKCRANVFVDLKWLNQNSDVLNGFGRDNSELCIGKLQTAVGNEGCCTRLDQGRSLICRHRLQDIALVSRPSRSSITRLNRVDEKLIGNDYITKND